MSGNNSRTVRRAQAGTTEAPWVRYTLLARHEPVPFAAWISSIARRCVPYSAIWSAE